MPRKNILLLESISEEAHQLLQENSRLLIASSPFTGGEIAEKESIHGIITRGKGDVSAALIRKCPELSVIARCGVGLDNVDVDFASEQGVSVLNAPGSNADTVAEHTLALILTLQRDLYGSIAAVKNNQWAFRNRYQGDEIRGKTLGIIGMGNIGKRVAQLAQAFGMRIVYWGRSSKVSDYTFLPKDELLAQADIISLHLPLSEETRNLISASVLHQMQPHALLINTSRGKIIDQEALVKALQERKIGGFATDVLSTEPPEQDHPLLRMPNVLITPHSASLTKRTYNEICVVSVRNALAILDGNPVEPQYIFNRDKLG